MTQPSLFAVDPLRLDDSAWLVRVRDDAGRWWASTDREGTERTCPLWLGKADAGYWLVYCRSDRSAVGGRWAGRDVARLWLWLALGICSWQLVPDVSTARATWGDELDAAEARLRRAMGEGV